MSLTEDEKSFLAHHGYSPEDVYDGRWLSKPDWQAAATREGKLFVLGTPCRARGHRLRTRAGHCVQCDPKKIAYVLRFSSSAYVYIAGSSSGLLVKIGTAINAPQRENQLRAERYGGYGDWTIVFNVLVEEAGRIEYNARTRLARYQISRPYWKDGVQQRAEELLQCSFSVALEAVTWACWTYDFE